MEFNREILQQLNQIGIALSKERRLPVLLEKILESAKELTEADGGTIYSVVEGKELHFEVVISDSLCLHLTETPFPNLPLSNDNLMVAYAVNHKKTLNIKDAYEEEGFDFSGTRAIDEKSGYRTKAVLTVPMMDHEGEVIAVLQLINPKNTPHFSEEAVELAKSLASQAGVALNNQLLIENLRTLFESLIRVIAEAIDEKSPSTGNHGKRVPTIAKLLAEAVGEFTSEQLYELEIAALLHDCGKITTPVHIIEKKKKLEGLCDRIELIEARGRGLISGDDLEFLRRCNEMKEPITEEAVERIKRIGALEWKEGKPLLTQDEQENLLIPKGNLTEKERKIIENHVLMTYRMLSQLPFPKELSKVPEIAASHHERMDGKGYPRGLMGDEMSSRARILAIADVFESLSAPDRPYRKPAPLSEVFKMMQEMVDEGHLDPNLFDVFLKKKAYLPYATRYLMPEQLDVD